VIDNIRRAMKRRIIMKELYPQLDISSSKKICHSHFWSSSIPNKKGSHLTPFKYYLKTAD
ncbi:hypothetical protein, partial [Piscinibacter sp.]|uniref:hypothetical protein n=1 Tax=Piscinibacter sp. TaxID=1903157 RepID=UPI003783F202